MSKNHFSGFVAYFVLWKLQRRVQSIDDIGVTNNGFVPDESNSSFNDEKMVSNETLKLEDDANITSHRIKEKFNQENLLERDTIEVHALESIEYELVDEDNGHLEAINTDFIVDEAQIVSDSEVVKKSFTSNFDRISLADDIVYCSKSRESNQTTYSIEQENPNKTKTNSDSQIGLSNNEKQVGNMLDSKEKQIDDFAEKIDPNTASTSEKNIQLDKVEEEENGKNEEIKKVIAIVHAPNETNSNSIDIDETNHETKSPVNKHQKHKDAKNMNYSNSNSIQKPNFCFGAYEAIPKKKLLFENDNEMRAFKMRLENLFTQSSNSSNTLQKKSPLDIPSFEIQSNSAPESLILHTNKMTINEQIPSNTNSEEITSKIPIPPAFDQKMYETIGRRNKIQYQKSLSATPSYDTDIDKRKNDETNSSENLKQIQNYDGNVNDENVSSIRNKLEKIFSKSLLKETNAEDNVPFPSNDSQQNDKSAHPSDTMVNQKRNSDDAREQINSDITGNLNRKNSFTSDDKTKEFQHQDSVD